MCFALLLTLSLTLLLTLMLLSYDKTNSWILTRNRKHCHQQFSKSNLLKTEIDAKANNPYTNNNFYFRSSFLSLFSRFWNFQTATMKFYDAVYPIHFMSKLSGITIFSIDTDSFETSFEIIDAVLFALVFVVNVFINKTFLCSFSFSSHYQSEIISTSLPILLYGKFWVNILCIVWSFLARNKIARIVKMIQEVDELVKTELF